jgi:hypothetical protein
MKHRDPNRRAKVIARLDAGEGRHRIALAEGISPQQVDGIAREHWGEVYAGLAFITMASELKALRDRLAELDVKLEWFDTALWYKRSEIQELWKANEELSLENNDLKHLAHLISTALDCDYPNWHEGNAYLAWLLNRVRRVPYRAKEATTQEAGEEATEDQATPDAS